jgi:hypothetical protein
MAISGSIVNVVEERRSERWVLVWGVLAGVVGGFIPPTLSMLTRRSKVVAED